MIEAKMMSKEELEELKRVYLNIAYLEEYKEHGWQLLKEENERLNTEIEQLREVMKSDTTTDKA